MCLAAAQLYGTLDAVPPGLPVSIASEQVLWSTLVPAGTQNPAQYQILAAVLEFDVSLATQLTIRSVVTKTPGSWGPFSDPVADPQNNFGTENIVHVRGYWRSADVLVNLPGVFDCTLVQPPPTFVEFGCCEQQGLEGGLNVGYYSLKNSLAKNATDNRACYGANLHYSAQVKNESTVDPARVYVGIRRRGIEPAKFFGAGRIDQPVFAATCKLPPIPMPAPGQPPNTSYGDQLLRGYDLTAATQVGHIDVAPGQQLTVRVALTTGGGAGTPFNLILGREAIWEAVDDPIEDQE